MLVVPVALNSDLPGADCVTVVVLEAPPAGLPARPRSGLSQVCSVPLGYGGCGFAVVQAAADMCRACELHDVERPVFAAVSAAHPACSLAGGGVTTKGRRPPINAMAPKEHVHFVHERVDLCTSGWVGG